MRIEPWDGNRWKVFIDGKPSRKFNSEEEAKAYFLENGGRLGEPTPASEVKKDWLDDFEDSLEEED